jgi:hypothetical protein
MQTVDEYEPELLEKIAVAKKTTRQKKMQDKQKVDGDRQKAEADMQQREQSMANTMMSVAQAMQQLAHAMSAPTEIVRDPKTGKTVGARKIING